MPLDAEDGVAHAAASSASRRVRSTSSSGRREDDPALDHVDVEGRQAHVVERVAEQHEEDDADARPADLALAAGQAGAADDGGADDVEQRRAGADRRPPAAESGGIEDRRRRRRRNPEMTKTRTITRRTGTPEISAALALLPTA